MRSESRHVNYWPGFVDALSNMVLAMVFIMLVLSLAVAMYSVLATRAVAQRLAPEAAVGAAAGAGGTAGESALVQVPQSPSVRDTRRPSEVGLGAGAKAAAPTGPLAAARVDVKQGAAPAQVPSASGRVHAGLARPNVVVVTFEGMAVAMSEEGTRSFDEAVQPMAAWIKSGHAELVASAPAGYLTDNQQLSFYRLMAVRNLLLAKGMAPGRIQVRVSDAPLAGDLGIVRVSFGAAPTEVVR
jgi:hypothetical protein